MCRQTESLDQRSSRLLDQSALAQSQAQFLNEISALLREQSQCLGARSRMLRGRMAALAAGQVGLPDPPAPDNLADAAL